MGVKLSLSVSESDVSVANNTSYVTAKLYAHSDYGSYNANNRDGYIKIDGTTYSFSNNFSANTTTLLATKSKTVTHNSDGSKTCSVSASYSSGVSSGTVTASTTKTLTTIPRASSFSCASSATVGSTLTGTISRHSSDFTHKVWFTLGGATFTIATAATTSISWTIPDSVLPYMTSTSASVTVYCQTYDGSTKIGSAVSDSLTIKLRSTDVPTISNFTASKSNGGSYWIRGINNLSASFSASASYGTTISSYRLVFGSQSVNAASATFSCSTAGNITLTAYATDARGRTTTSSQTITVYEYYKPTIGSLLAERCTAAGVADANGTNLRVKFSYGYCSSTPVSSTANNTLATTVTVKIGTISNNYSLTTPTSGTYAVVSGVTIPLNNQANVTVTIRDSYGNSANISDIVNTAEKILSIKGNGKGMGIGQYAVNDGLEIGWNTKFNGNVTFTGQDSIYNSIRVGGYPLTTVGARYSAVPFVASDGAMEVGRYIDFHQSNTDTSDYNPRLEASGNNLQINGNKIITSSFFEIKDLKDYGLTCTAGSKYTISDYGGYLMGNVIRFNFSATRSSASDTGNIPNETVCTFRWNSGIISDIYNICFPNSASGGVASFSTTNTTNTSFDVSLNAVDTALSSTSALFLMPVVRIDY